MMMRRVQMAFAFSGGGGGDSAVSSTEGFEPSGATISSCNRSAIVASLGRFAGRWLLRFEVAAELSVQGSKQRSCQAREVHVVRFLFGQEHETKH
jgi:hypothetical protein